MSIGDYNKHMESYEKSQTLRKKERNKAVRLMRANNKTYQEIADIFHISRQRVHQILKDYKPTGSYKNVRLADPINRCAICNATKGLQVHHINKNSRNNTKENLIRLCTKCHHDIHNGGIHPRPFLDTVKRWFQRR